jgi:hypothetical protein
VRTPQRDLPTPGKSHGRGSARVHERGPSGEFRIESPDDSTARFPPLTCAGSIARLSGTPPGSAIHPAVPDAHGRRDAGSSRRCRGEDKEIRFEGDSPLERAGFEPSVPRGCARRVVCRFSCAPTFSVGGELSRSDIQRLVVSRGTDGSNPASSSGESSTNRPRGRRRSTPAPRDNGPGHTGRIARGR